MSNLHIATGLGPTQCNKSIEYNIYERSEVKQYEATLSNGIFFMKHRCEAESYRTYSDWGERYTILSVPLNNNKTYMII